MKSEQSTSLAKREQQSGALALVTEQSAMLLNLITASETPIAPSYKAICRRIDNVETLQISQHKKHNEEHLKASISLLLLNVFEFYGAEEARALRHIQLLIPQILRLYWHLTVEDIQLFADEAIQGRYGKVYGQLSGSVILQWLEVYAINRDNAIEALNMQSHYACQPIRDNLSSTDATRMLNQIMDRISNR